MAPPADDARSEAEPWAAAVRYQRWGWPVILRDDQVRLALEPDVTALIIPVLVAAQVTKILNQRRCPPASARPPRYTRPPGVAGRERYGVALPWPPGIHQASGTLPLPPTKIACGPITWVHPPEADALRLCREIDLFAALRIAMRDPPR